MFPTAQMQSNYASGLSEAPGASQAPGTYFGEGGLDTGGMSATNAFLRQLAMYRAQQEMAQRAQMEQAQRAAQMQAAAGQSRGSDQGGMMGMFSKMFGGGGQSQPQVTINPYLYG